MYILLCGKPPYNGKNDKDIIEKAETGNLEFFGKIPLYLTLIISL